MKKFKSILCLLLALIMVLGLAACGPKDAADDKKEDNKTEDKKDENKTDDKQEEVDPFAEAVTLKVIGQSGGGKPGQAEVEAELKRLVKEKDQC